ncbi:MAG TPA: tetratricopeptide repeat protein [Thermoanaerobaculia bacterium]|nr:tetratricopeptide repeat protein [Thermoanaerobaculia bacterium]
MTDWLSAAAMLLSGLVIGFMILYSMKWSKAATAAAADRELARRDLEAKRDALVARMREMADDDSDRARLESETAAVLRQLDSSAPIADRARSAEVSSPAKPAPRSSAFAGFAWGVLTAAIVGGVLFYVMQSAKPRAENEPTTGAALPNATKAQQPPQSDAVIQALEEQVAKTPDDLNLRNELAKAYFDRENLMKVFEQTEFVLKKAPGDAHALTYQALVRMAMGQNDEAQRMLETATKNDPQLVDSYVALAWLYMLRGRAADAEKTMNVAMTNHPDQKARLTDVLAQMRVKAANRPTETAAAAATAPSAAPVEGPVVHVTLSLASGATPPANATIFVYARAAGQTSGPPAAVKRLPVGAFPLSFDLSAADSMMGQPLPPSMRIEARIDSDGNAMTKSPTDLTAAQDNVSSGATVKLALQ